MKKYTYLTDHPRNRISREKLIERTNAEMRELDCLALMKLYAFAHRMRRDKVK